MPIETILLVFMFAVSMVGSPGPANMALMAAGAGFGYRKSAPFLLGTISGFFLVGIWVAAGLGTLFVLFPPLRLAFLVLSAAYILYLAYRIAFQDPKISTADKRPGYFAGCIIHPLNPKAWVMLIAAFSQFIDPELDYFIQLTTILTIFTAVGLVLNSAWVYAGSLVNRLVKSTNTLRRINQGLAVLMIVVVAATLLQSDFIK
ncbi:MAG: LysE family translocator [Sneathiella sp.]|nr:LysE family translocator [Sneathiella sp.]